MLWGRRRYGIGTALWWLEEGVVMFDGVVRAVEMWERIFHVGFVLVLRVNFQGWSWHFSGEGI